MSTTAETKAEIKGQNGSHRNGFSFNNGYPSRDTSEKLYEELDYQRAVQAYIWATPLVNSIAMAKALGLIGLDPADPAMIAFNKPMSPRQIFPTCNPVSTYGFSCVDLSKTGPFVVHAPEGVLGGIVDFWQRAIVDIGIGPSLKGGKFLLLPDVYIDGVPEGYIPACSRTNRVWIFGRGALSSDDPDGPLKRLASVGLYPLSRKKSDRTTKMIYAGDVPMNTNWPDDYRYFEYLAEGLSDVIVEPEDKLMYGMLKPLGIEPGKPFRPTNRQRNILTRAAETGSAMIANMAFANRFDDRQIWPDREWEKLTFASTPVFATSERVELDERAQAGCQFQMKGGYQYDAEPLPGQGSWYASTFRDGSGEFLEGAKSYKLTVPPDPPAKDFWSLTIYNNRTRSMIDTDQQRPGIGCRSKPKKNPDGSIDLYFGPKAPEGMEKNWIKTIPGEGFFAMFRLFGPLEPVFDGTWKINDLERF